MARTTIIMLSLGLLFFNDAYRPNQVPKARHNFIVIAHRGDHQLYPENTLAAYQQAILNGADYVEIDLRTTSDGELVSLHDNTVDRMTNGKGQVKEMSLKQLLGLKIISKNQNDTTSYCIPTFKQIMDLCINKIYIYIDFKEADAASTYRMLMQYHMEKQVIIYINKPGQYTDWRKIYPIMPLMVSLPDSVNNADRLKAYTGKFKPDILDGNYNGYSREMVKFADRSSLPVWPDAQSATEGPENWNNAIASGLRGLQTDHVPQLVAYLKQRGLR